MKTQSTFSTVKIVLFLLLVNSCSINKHRWNTETQTNLDKYTHLLSQAELATNAEDILVKGLRKDFGMCKRKYTAALPQLMVLLNDKNKASSAKDFLNRNADMGYFDRDFNGVFGYRMVYRFTKVNEYGLGIAYLSDRYENAYFDKNTSQNIQAFIKDRYPSA